MTLQEIATLAGVSQATVSLVLNNKPGVGAEKREQIRALLEKYEYEPQRASNPPAITKGLLFLKYVRSGRIVEENTGFIATILDSIGAECQRRKYPLRIETSQSDLEATLKNIDYSLLDGILVLGTEMDPSAFELLRNIPIPYIVIDNRMPDCPCNAITMNNWEMVHTAVRALADKGFERIGYFKGKFPPQNFLDREEGMEQACRAYGLTQDPGDVFELTPTLLGSYADMKAYLEAVRKLPPCAFADNDIIALGAMKAILEAGYSIPDDISIIGFDDIIFSAANAPTLSTMQVAKETIGEQAVRTLVSNINNPDLMYCKQFIGGTLILRESTK
ncbi:MAG: LacI family DNA-binding transcriptional regulator [Lachnospiraceae bacterium]|nr:LacI family DNA-binding transcriptional regulator [Lachnospiraceae bacterium]